MATEKTTLASMAIDWAERQLLPDSIVRFGIRSLAKKRLDELHREAAPAPELYKQQFLEMLRAGQIAEDTEKANEQHYEVPPDFFVKVLGPRLKYSACIWPDGVETLKAAEEATLKQYCERADIRPGMNMLDLGCGWGSLALYIVEHIPDTRVTAVSNSAPQGDFIRARASGRFEDRIRHVKADVNTLQLDQTYDRIVSVEMLEHVRNYARLFERISTWLKPDGRMFVHIFTHQKWPYLFQSEGDLNWMGRYFFSGGTMPSHDLLPRVCAPLSVTQSWQINGKHYARTLEAWLQQMDECRSDIIPIFEPVYGSEDTERWIQRWRIFFMACSEVFGYADGREWGVSHYLLKRAGS